MVHVDLEDLVQSHALKAENLFLDELGPRTRMPGAKSRVQVNLEDHVQSHACEISRCEKCDAKCKRCDANCANINGYKV